MAVISIQFALEFFLARGFDNGTAKEHFGDREYPGVLKNCLYLYRRSERGTHEYVSLPFYDGALCEAIFEEYSVPKNTRKPPNNVWDMKGKPPLKQSEVIQAELQKHGFAPINLGIIRTFPELQKKFPGLSNSDLLH